MAINWMKVIGNAGVAFFTSVMGLTAAGTLTSLEMSLTQYMVVVLIVAGGQGGAAFFREVTKQSENPPSIKKAFEESQFEKLTDNPEEIKIKSKICKIHSILKYITI